MCQSLAVVISTDGKREMLNIRMGHDVFQQRDDRGFPDHDRESIAQEWHSLERVGPSEAGIAS